MNVYGINLQLIATAYIVAESEDEAKKIIARELTDCGAELLEESTGGFVRGAPYETLIEEIEDDEHLPRASISPAITVIGPCEDEELEQVTE